MINLYNYLIEYIEKSKEKYDIDYKASIDNLKDLLEEIEEEYKNANLIKRGEE